MGNEDELIDEMVAASRAFVAIAAKSIGELAPDLTLPQYRAIVVLASAGDQNLSALASALGVSPSTASRLCDRLVGKGLICRVQSALDRREVRLSITEPGLALFNQVMARRREVLGPVVAGLPQAGRQQLLRALRAINAAL